VRDGVDVDARRHVVFVEDDVVRERLVVDEFNRFTSLDRDGRRLFIGKSRASVSLRARSSSSSSTRAGSPRVRIGRRALTVSRGSLGGVRRVARASRRVASRRVTHVETELAVITAELDGRRERRGGHRERRRGDDRSLRASEIRSRHRQSAIDASSVARAIAFVARASVARARRNSKILDRGRARADARRRALDRRVRDAGSIRASPANGDRGREFGARANSRRTFLKSMDAHALVETVFFATVVLETTRTPVKEVVKADMTMSSAWV